MPKQSANLDHLFRALADPTRRAVIERLSHGPGTTSELAQGFRMTLPSFVQHLDALEDCGLIASAKAGRVRTYRLVATSLKAASRWLDARFVRTQKRTPGPDVVGPGRTRKGSLS